MRASGDRRRGTREGFAATGESSPRRSAAESARLTRAAEKALIAAARRGDEKALARLLERASVPAFRFSLGFCRDPHDAEDLAQDVMATLLRSLDSFRGDSSLSTWTYVVARRACVRRRRRAARQSSLDEMPPGRVERADPASEPHRRLERRELGEALERAIATLPEGAREVIVLRDVEGLPAAEVATILGIGERAVKSRLHRARLLLREQLAPFVPGGDAPEPASGCPDTARMLSRYVEGELGPGVCARMEAHVNACPSCEGACESLRQVLGACRELGEAPMPRELERSFRAAIRAVLAERGGRRAQNA